MVNKELIEMPLEAQYAYYLSQIICDKSVALSIAKARGIVIRMLYARMMTYYKQGYREELLRPIFFKKSNYVLKSKTKKEIQKALDYSDPVYYGGEIKDANNEWHSDEEEMIQWSLLSFDRPLNDEAMKRYEILVKRILPKEAERIFGN